MTEIGLEYDQKITTMMNITENLSPNMTTLFFEVML